MRYALLFYNRPHTEIPERDREAVLSEMVEAMHSWHQDLEHAGAFRMVLRLAPVDGARCVRAEGGDVHVTDGPFAETKEILGGLTVIECADRDEALAWARRCPLARIGTVEVRPEWR